MKRQFSGIICLVFLAAMLEDDRYRMRKEEDEIPPPLGAYLTLTQPRVGSQNCI